MPKTKNLDASNKKNYANRSSKRSFGLAEWYGSPIWTLTASQRKEFSQIVKVKSIKKVAQPCPFRAALDPKATCTKKGGTCSFIQYNIINEKESGSSCEPVLEAGIETFCPNRFLQNLTVFKQISEFVLGTSKTEECCVIREVDFMA